jgi:hypothetical protein
MKRIKAGRGETSRSELLNAIRKRIKDITNGEFNRPVFLKDVSVFDPERNPSENRVIFSLNNLFYSSDGKLCGDLIPLLRTNRGNFLFGKMIENLRIDDLNNILKNLNRDNWFVMDFEDDFSDKKSGSGIRDLFVNNFRRGFS